MTTEKHDQALIEFEEFLRQCIDRAGNAGEAEILLKARVADDNVVEITARAGGAPGLVFDGLSSADLVLTTERFEALLASARAREAVAEPVAA